MIKLKPEKLAKVKKVASRGQKNVVGLSEAASLRIRMQAAQQREELDRKKEKRRKRSERSGRN